MNYEILIRISLGDNFALNDEYVSKECKTCVFLEAKFNDETLQSDPIEISSPNPELATELGFRLNKKDFQQFRIERKSVKMQCYVEYSTLDEREYIGYAILHLRDAHDYSPTPKFSWHVLLNPKYKGHAGKRPQLYLAFMVNKLKDENDMNTSFVEMLNDSIENHVSSPLKRPEPERSMTRSMISSLVHEPEFDANLKVKYQNKLFYIWDENKYTEGLCNQMFLVQVQLERPENLVNLFGDKTYKQLEQPSPFYFKYTLFGKQIRTRDFLDIFHFKDFKRHKAQFPILTIARHVLKRYFELYPTLEVQFCMGQAEDTKIIGFVTLNLLRLFENHTGNIGADYMIVPEDENVFVKEPFPVVNVAFSICKKDHAKLISDLITSTSNKSNETTATASDNGSSIDSSISYGSSTLSHYYIAIDLRSIRLCGDNLQNCHILFEPFYLQFTYAFFGIVDNVKTYPAIQFSADNQKASITIPHGFCGFNFATTYDKLEYTFNEIPFIVQLVSEKNDTLLGTAKINLACLLQKSLQQKNNDLGDNFINTFVHVFDELNDQICEIQVVMFLQDIQNITSLCPENVEKFTSNSEDCKSKILENLNEMIIDTAHDIETWKEEQMKLFKTKLKQKEQEFLDSLNNSHESTKEELEDMERNIRSTLENLNSREERITEKETRIEMRQKELDAKLSRISHEIDQAIYDVRLQYEEKTNTLRTQLKTLEQEKCKIQEKNYSYERKLKERDAKIKDLEKELADSTTTAGAAAMTTSTTALNSVRNRSTSRATSLTRSVCLSAPPRKPTVHRDTPATNILSRSMIENKATELPSRSTSARPPQGRRFSSASSRNSIINVNNSNSNSKSNGSSTTNTTANRFGYSATLERHHSTSNSSTPVRPNSASSRVNSIHNKTSTTFEPIDKIKRERMDLIKKGISVKDPLIVEIDKRLRAHRLSNNVRI